MINSISSNDIPYYQVNTVMAVLMATSFTALFILMIILKPITVLNRLATWFAFCCAAVTWRSVAGLLRPEIFGVRESLYASLFFAVATIVTTSFGIVAWYEHVGDMLRYRSEKRDKRRGWCD